MVINLLVLATIVKSLPDMFGKVFFLFDGYLDGCDTRQQDYDSCNPQGWNSGSSTKTLCSNEPNVFHKNERELRVRYQRVIVIPHSHHEWEKKIC